MKGYGLHRRRAGQQKREKVVSRRAGEREKERRREGEKERETKPTR